jgi:hypothetical protein
MKYTKEEAIVIANGFITEVNKLEKKYNMSFNSDTGDVYLSFKSNEDGKVWDSISLGWKGDGTGISVMEEDYLKAKQTVQKYEKQLNISDVMCELKSLKKRVKYLEKINRKNDPERPRLVQPKRWLL